MIIRHAAKGHDIFSDAVAFPGGHGHHSTLATPDVIPVMPCRVHSGMVGFFIAHDYSGGV